MRWQIALTRKTSDMLTVNQQISNFVSNTLQLVWSETRSLADHNEKPTNWQGMTQQSLRLKPMKQQIANNPTMDLAMK